MGSPPARPLLVFDGDCGFCRFWVDWWRRRSGDRIDYEPFQKPEIAERFPEIPREDFVRAVHFIEPDGRTSAGAEAVFRLLAALSSRLALALYEHVPGVRPLTEWGYRFVADHRPFFARVTTWLWGRREDEATRPRTYALAAWLFLRLLGVVYLAAFWSLASQIIGLVGSNGILPAHLYMEGARNLGGEAFFVLPTLALLSTSDVFLRGLCISGAALAALLIVGIVPVVVLPLLWFSYLSVAIVCRDFLFFQWDILLLEAGFLAIFIAPSTLRDRLRRAIDPPRFAVWLLLYLLFRLMLGSGAVKLASGDPAWRGLTALNFHFETQPIPTPVAWYAHRLPSWFLKGSTAAVLGIELAVPFFIFGPRRVRLLAFWMFVGLQAVIALTGNYAFFNLLSVSLCVLLLDDAALERALRVFRPAKAGRYDSSYRTDDDSAARPGRVRHALIAAVAIVTVPVATLLFASSLGVELPGWPLVAPIAGAIAPFRSVGSYGLFAVMTTSRPEIVVEGSDDGVVWSAYEFKYKPGDLRRAPPWVAPHQPRLDWQMWFAALSRYQNEPWFAGFCGRLLEGAPDVLRLIERDPFGGRPPRYVRASLYEYHFSDAATRRSEGVWWTRERLGDYSPVLSLAGNGR